MIAPPAQISIISSRMVNEATMLSAAGCASVVGMTVLLFVCCVVPMIVGSPCYSDVFSCCMAAGALPCCSADAGVAGTAAEGAVDDCGAAGAGTEVYIVKPYAISSKP